MATKSLLINYNDCPSSLDSFIPDNGLANLAGSLISKGNKTEIFDYSTAQTLKDFRPKEIRKKLKKAFLRYKLETLLFGKMSKGAYNVFREIDLDIQSLRNKKIAAIVEEISKKIDLEKLDFIAFKLWSGEGFLGSIKIAQQLKNMHPQIKIFAGGPHAEVFGERIFAYTNAFDVLCQGEGEEVITQLSEYAEGKSELNTISNIIYREKDKIIATPIKFIENLDSIADPIYDKTVYRAMEGNEKLKIVMLEESRGCPYSCNFCIHRIKSGDRWRIRNVDNVINTIRRLSTDANTKAFRLSGSNTPHFFRKQFAECLIKNAIDIQYIGFADTRQPQQEDYALLKKSGCVSLFFGIETADPYLLEHIINKKTDPEWIKDSLIKAREAGILTSASIIVPCPGETEESLKKTIALLAYAKPYGVSVYPGICYPKTKWFLESKKFGFELLPDVEDRMMTYTIKFTMPPPLLAPLPFKVDGKDFHTMIDEVIKASHAIEKKGITTGLNDSLLFVGHVLHMSPKEVKQLNQTSIILGEYEKLQGKISAFNDNVRLRR